MHTKLEEQREEKLKIFRAQLALAQNWSGVVSTTNLPHWHIAPLKASAYCLHPPMYAVTYCSSLCIYSALHSSIYHHVD
jgi:hypothetical protein